MQKQKQIEMLEEQIKGLQGEIFRLTLEIQSLKETNEEHRKLNGELRQKINELENHKRGMLVELFKANDKIDKALKIIDSYDLGKYDYSIPPGGIIELRDSLKGDSDV